MAVGHRQWAIGRPIQSAIGHQQLAIPFGRQIATLLRLLLRILFRPMFKDRVAAGVLALLFLATSGVPLAAQQPAARPSTPPPAGPPPPTLPDIISRDEQG